MKDVHIEKTNQVTFTLFQVMTPASNLTSQDHKK